MKRYPPFENELMRYQPYETSDRWGDTVARMRSQPDGRYYLVKDVQNAVFDAYNEMQNLIEEARKAGKHGVAAAERGEKALKALGEAIFPRPVDTEKTAKRAVLGK